MSLLVACIFVTFWYGICRVLAVICRRMNSPGAAAVVVAALCHDVGHPGRNNAFFSAGRSPLVSSAWVKLVSVQLIQCCLLHEWVTNLRPVTTVPRNTIGVQAILYNDRSVLENFHSALTFKVLSHSPCNIFGALSKPVSGPRA